MAQRNSTLKRLASRRLMALSAAASSMMPTKMATTSTAVAIGA